jgi:two-component system CheB/CheR fusion protein
MTPQDTPSADARFPIVGIGASAGGLEAFEALFRAMPAHTGMAFVLLQHLAPDHQSILSQLIQRSTAMPVTEVTDGLVVQPDSVYVVPPGFDVALLGGALQLLSQLQPRGPRLPIDHLFRSLAQDQRVRAIGVVLSGTGSDGTLGVREIKAEGGLVVAQTPETCGFDGMPRSAIATGEVDYVLAPAEMPALIQAYVAHTLTRPLAAAPDDLGPAEPALQKVFLALRDKTGHDFSHYKPGTIQRRIERRMALHQIGAMADYARFLAQTPAEVEALFRDLLIGVTGFFRDPQAFQALQDTVLPRLFAGPSAAATIRVWVPGCSTGEEAYSIAILLHERMQAVATTDAVQVFATDIDPRAVATARAGLYPAGIAADVSAERLARCFTAEPDGSGYRVNKPIRDLLVFSEQNVIRDPPFSKLDLISCRNLMIYLGAGLQARLIELFHYALKPGGTLLLGTSETVGDAGDLFCTLDRSAKLYRQLEEGRGARHLAERQFGGPLARPGEPPLPRAAAVTAVTPAKPSLRQITEQALLRQDGVAAVLVRSRGDILYIHGRSGRYLEPAPGEAGVSNLLKMAREGLRHDLAAALQRAVSSQQTQRVPGLQVLGGGQPAWADLAVIPLPAAETPEPALYLVVLGEGCGPIAAPADPATGPAGGDSDARVAMLRRELRAKEDFLEAANEALAVSNDELRAASEEMQSVNEELQSTNEELETSKEELQSVNEELATVNAELQTKVADLSRANNDMNNLLAGTGIATVFVDRALHILRFTPAATGIIPLIAGDIGRPVGHIASNLVGYDSLAADAQAVLDTLIPRETAVQTAAGPWYTMRMQPYRTLNNVIEGAVITFVDITETVRARDTLRQANELLRLAVVVRDAYDAITVQDLNGRMLAWNPGAVRLYGWSEAEALRMNVRERIPPGLREQALVKVHQLSQAEVLEPYRSQRINQAGQVLEVSMISTALFNEAGHMYAIATTERALPGQTEAPAAKHDPTPA